MVTKTKGWPVERRRKQAARMKTRKIWKQSTGPKSKRGKARSARNAFRHGHRSAEMSALRKLLSLQAAYLAEHNARQRHENEAS